jgi:hypothetical protein
MAQEYRIDTVLVTNRVRLNNNAKQGVVGLPSAAWYGEPAIAGVRIDDPLGELDLRGWHTFTHDETSCTGNERTFSGWIVGKTIDRGPLPFRYGAARVWECEVHDLNTAFSLEVFRASSAKRPEETDIERVAWAQASAPMAGTPLNDNGRFNTTDNPVGFGPSDYITQFPQGLFESVAGTSGKNFYAYFDQTASEPSLHYDLVGVGPTSTLSISNVESDASSTCFYPFIDAQLSRSAADQVTGLLFGFLGGQYVYGRNAALIDALSPTEFSPVNFLRDAVYTTDRVGKVATANALLQNQLAARAVEVDTITCSIRVPAAQVNLLMAGDLVDVKFIHLPAYEDFVTVPVIRRNVIPTDGRRDMYDLHLTLSNEVQAVGPGGGDPGGSPYEPPSCDPADAVPPVNSGHTIVSIVPDVVLPFTPTAGNTVVLWLAHATTRTVQVDGFTEITGNIDTPTFGGAALRGHMVYRTIESGDTDTFTVTQTGSQPQQTLVIAAELSGVWLPTDFGTVTATDGGCTGSRTGNVGTVTPSTPTSLLIAAESVLTDVTDTYAFAFDTFTEIDDTFGNGAPNGAMGYRTLDPVSGSVTEGGTWTFSGCNRGWASVVVAFSCSGESLPPGALQIVRDEHVADGDGTTTDFTTDWPYVSGSLRVYVDGVQIINGLTEVDPDAGTFSLDFAPLGAIGDSRAEIVTATYQASVGGPGT